MFTFGEFRKTVYNVIKSWLLEMWLDEEFFSHEDVDLLDILTQFDKCFVKDFRQEYNFGELERQILILKTKNEI